MAAKDKLGAAIARLQPATAEQLVSWLEAAADTSYFRRNL
jgi:hypothetical protein